MIQFVVTDTCEQTAKTNQRLPEQLMDEYPKFTFAPVAKRVFVRNYLYENMMSPVQSFA